MKRPTIKDVAAAAGVSAQTVSRVVNDHPRVSPATRARVTACIDDLNYRPSAVARGLQANRSFSIGVLLWGIQYFGPAQTLTGIVDACGERALTVTLAELPKHLDFNPARAVASLVEHRVDGIVMSVPEIGGSTGLLDTTLRTVQVPVVFVRTSGPARYSRVVIDNVGTMARVVDHLITTGRHKIVHIGGHRNWEESRDRIAGWRRALQAAGLAHGDDLIVHGDWEANSGAAAMHRLLDDHPDLDAVAVANDRMALGALEALRARGRCVPVDVAVTGFDDIPEAAWVQPSLTSVSQPLQDVGRLAVETLIAQIDDPTTAPTVKVLDAGLIIRASSRSLDQKAVR